MNYAVGIALWMLLVNDYDDVTLSSEVVNGTCSVSVMNMDEQISLSEIERFVKMVTDGTAQVFNYGDNYTIR